MFWWIMTWGHDATLPDNSNSVTSQNTPRRTSEFIKTTVSCRNNNVFHFCHNWCQRRAGAQLRWLLTSQVSSRVFEKVMIEHKSNEILTFCNRVMKSEVRKSRMRRNIVSDMNAKCQYFFRGVLNHDFVDDMLMSREEIREVSSRPSCALTWNMTAMQNIIIHFKKVLFQWITKSVVRCVVMCVVKRHDWNCEAPFNKHKCNMSLFQVRKWCFDELWREVMMQLCLTILILSPHKKHATAHFRIH